MRHDMKLLWATGLFAAIAGVLVGVLVVRAAGGPKTGPIAEPMEVGTEANLRTAIRSHGPVLFPDLAGGDQAFYVLDIEGELRAVRAFTRPGTGCPVVWRPREQHLEDCEGAQVDPSRLDQFELTAPQRPGEAVLVDPRHLIRAGGNMGQASHPGEAKEKN